MNTEPSIYNRATLKIRGTFKKVNTGLKYFLDQKKI